MWYRLLRPPTDEIKHYPGVDHNSMDVVSWNCPAVAAPGKRVSEEWNKWMVIGKDIPVPGKPVQVFEQFGRDVYRKRSENESRRRRIFHALHARNDPLQHEKIAPRHDDEKPEWLSDGETTTAKTETDYFLQQLSRYKLQYLAPEQGSVTTNT